MWFKTIKEKVLADSFSREVIEAYKTKDINWTALRARKQRLSKDKKKKEWVITKENNILIARKIVKITKERFIMEHWKIEETSNSLQLILSKYKRCIYSSKNSTGCIISKSLSK